MKSWLQQRKSQGALETVFKIFILLVVVGVVVALFLKVIGVAFTGGPGGSELLQKKTDCEAKCTENSNDWAEFCLKDFRLDFDKDKRYTSEYKGSEVLGIGVCESNVKCYNIFRCELPNGQVLNAPKCAQELATYYSGVTDDPAVIGNKVSEALNAGTCGEAGGPPEAYCLAFPDQCAQAPPDGF